MCRKFRAAEMLIQKVLDSMWWENGLKSGVELESDVEMVSPLIFHRTVLDFDKHVSCSLVATPEIIHEP